jgi:hypothetical protein
MPNWGLPNFWRIFSPPLASQGFRGKSEWGDQIIGINPKF